MRILVALTYYRPHTSGLTIYAERLARELAARGHGVTVLASQHDPSLPREEEADGVRVVRVPVAFRISKGVVMPTYGFHATREVLAHDVLSVHLPQLDAWGLALRGRLLRRPCVLTYHCDLSLPGGAVHRVAERAVATANGIAAAAAHRIVAYTQEYADHSPLLRRHASKVEVIGPPVVLGPPSAADVARFRRRHGLAPEGSERGPVIGFAARLAAEKGVDTLLAAAPALLERYPRAAFLFAGPHEGIVGEEEYRRRLAPAIERLGDAWTFLGTLDPQREMPAFFGALDCLVVPSVNSTESFGLVQVEAMLCGTPVVASDLPGVRQPVLRTGMGAIAPPGNATALARSVERVLERRETLVRPREEIRRLFDPERTLDAYEELFERELEGRGRAGLPLPRGRAIP
jgi:glycosyltransferase involved in cell wall biosynthesis